MSLIDEHNGRHVRMGHLAFLGSHKVNGVSALHSELVKETVFRDLHEMFPDRIVNKTNGVTFRRWLFEANPALTRLLVETIGKEVLDDRSVLEKLEPLADDLDFQARCARGQAANKERAGEAHRRPAADQGRPDAMFDVQIKRIHEYKRQLLNILETIALYNEIRAQPMRDLVPARKNLRRQGGGELHTAKLVIKLANDVARVVNNDPTVRGLLKVVFLPNYNVSLAEIDHSRRRPVGADFDRGHGGVGHRQHEDGAERRARPSARSTAPMSRSGSGSATTTSSSSASRPRRSRRARAKGIDAREIIDGLAGIARGAGIHRAAASSRRTTAAAIAASSTRSPITTTSWSAADFDAYCAAQTRVAALARPQGAGGAPPSSTPRVSAGSRPTAPSPNMPKTSGTSR